MQISIRIISIITVLLVVGLAIAQSEVAIGEPYTTEVIACPDSLTGQATLSTDPDVVAELSARFGGVEGLMMETEGETYECGIVYVPEDYSNPDGRVIDIFYLRYFATGDSPAADPLVYLAGGPGSSGSAELTEKFLLLSTINSIREDRDIIAYDQRGTGYSNYLGCALAMPIIGYVLETADDPELDEMVGSFFEQNAPIPINFCLLAYDVGTDVDVHQYHSVNSAQDIMHLTEALGYTDGYNLYGTSYGTRLAQTAMRETPDQINNVILDGVLPPNIPNAAYTISKRGETYVGIFEQCAADEACNAAYPNLPERFETLLNQLEANPIELDPPLIVNPNMVHGDQMQQVYFNIGPGFFQDFAGLNNAQINGGGANRVPKIIAQLEEGSTDLIFDLVSIEASPEELAEILPGSTDESFVVDRQAFVQGALQIIFMLAGDQASPPSNIAETWTSIVVDDLAGRIQAGEDATEVTGDIIRFALLPTAGIVDTAPLIEFANDTLSESARLAANAVATLMSHEDVRQTMWNIGDLANFMGGATRSNATGMQVAVNCSEDIPFSSVEDMEEQLANAPYTQMTIRGADVEQHEISTFSTCVGFETLLDESFTDPVESDIPTLIYNGLLDVQTPPSWGEIASESLSNSMIVEWGNMGHIAASHEMGTCVGGIAKAFLSDPTAELDTSCSESDAYKIPNWRLPDSE